MFHKIMVAYDDSTEASKALDAAIELTKTLPADLSIVTVIEPPPTYLSWAVSALPIIKQFLLVAQWIENKQTKYALLQTSARQKAKAAGLWLDTELVNGDEVDSIIGSAKRHQADLLILGMRKHSLLGHTATDLAQRAPCALMGVR
jgi:nucleotide-binding universal stress UspA family protein